MALLIRTPPIVGSNSARLCPPTRSSRARAPQGDRVEGPGTTVPPQAAPHCAAGPHPSHRGLKPRPSLPPPRSSRARAPQGDRVEGPGTTVPPQAAPHCSSIKSLCTQNLHRRTAPPRSSEPGNAGLGAVSADLRGDEGGLARRARPGHWPGSTRSTQTPPQRPPHATCNAANRRRRGSMQDLVKHEPERRPRVGSCDDEGEKVDAPLL
jgi:hypothetical protein